jgi:urease accessory protein
VKAHARLTVERDERGRDVVRGLRSAAPLTLMPARGDGSGPAVVRLVNSAAAPLGGDELELTVRVGPGARLALSGVAATLALPGHRFEPSRFTLRLELAERSAVEYLPEPTIVTGRARHESLLHAHLAAGAVLRCREMLVLGRDGERPGRLSSTIHVVRAGRPVLRQRLEIGDPVLDAGLAHLAGRRVLVTEIMISDAAAAPPAGGDWWSRSPLAGGGWSATALADDALTASGWIDAARVCGA